MPNISLLEPMVLNGVVQKFTSPQNLTLLPNVPSSPSNAPDYVTWDVLKGSRQLAGFNLPGAEAHTVDQLGRTQESAQLAYIRLKKVFQPQLMHWLREPGQIAATNAEAMVLRELQDLSQRIDLVQEQLLWNALRGTSTISYPDGSSATVNYGFPSSHIVAPAVDWNNATPENMINDLVTWKRLVQTHGRVKPTTAYCSILTIQEIFNAFAANSGVVVNPSVTTGAVAAYPMGTMLSDRMKDEYYTNGILPGFAGLDWIPVEEVYTNSTGFLTRFVGDGVTGGSGAELFLGNFTEQRPFEVKLGKSADDSAPEGMYGKFTKTWKQEDPSARIVLMELHFLPVVYRPEQFIYCGNVNSTTVV
jgi:hypothetical protein